MSVRTGFYVGGGGGEKNGGGDGGNKSFFEFKAKHAAKAAKAARNVAVDAVVAVENRWFCHIYND